MSVGKLKSQMCTGVESKIPTEVQIYEISAPNDYMSESNDDCYIISCVTTK